MEKKIILEEIYRISELMTINPKINLFEQNQELVKFLEDGAKVGARSMDEFIDKLSQSGIKQADLIANSFKDLITKEVLSQTEKEFASQVIRDVFPYIDKEVDGLLNNLEPKKLNNVKKYFNDPKISVDKKIEKLKKWGYEDANPLMVQVWADEMNKIKRPIVIPNPHVEPHVEPTPIVMDEASADELFDLFNKTSGNEEIITATSNTLEDELLKLQSEKKINLGGVNAEDVAKEIAAGIGKKSLYDTEVMWEAFNKFPPSEQLRRANKAVLSLQKELDKKGKTWLSRWVGKKWKNLDKVDLITFGKRFATFWAACSMIMAIATILELFYTEKYNWSQDTWRGNLKDILLKVVKGPLGILETIYEILTGDSTPNGETITTEAQLRAALPCLNGETGLQISPIVNNKCTFTYSDGGKDDIIIKGNTATFVNGNSIC